MAVLHAAALPPGWSVASIATLLDTPGTQALIASAPIDPGCAGPTSPVRFATGEGSGNDFPPPCSEAERGRWQAKPDGGGTPVDVPRDIVGFVVFRTVADEAEILTIAVSADARRQGLGRALLDVAMASARARGAVTLHLEVASNNEGARKFYAAAGFVETGRRARYYPDGADALLLSRTLA